MCQSGCPLLSGGRARGFFQREISHCGCRGKERSLLRLCSNRKQDLGKDKWPDFSFFLKYDTYLSHQSAKLKPEQSFVRNFKIQKVSANSSVPSCLQHAWQAPLQPLTQLRHKLLRPRGIVSPLCASCNKPWAPGFCFYLFLNVFPAHRLQSATSKCEC